MESSTSEGTRRERACCPPYSFLKAAYLTRVSSSRRRWPIDGSTSATTKWIYGDSGNPGLSTRIAAPRGNTTGTPNNTFSTVLTYDSSGNLTSSTDADGSQTTYTYDSVGRRTAMVDPDGNVGSGTPSQHTWTTAYDALDRVTSSSDPLSHSTATSYDGAGHVLTSTDKNGNITAYTYDAVGRLATVGQKPDPSGQPTLTYTTTVGRDDNGNATAVGAWKQKNAHPAQAQVPRVTPPA